MYTLDEAYLPTGWTRGTSLTDQPVYERTFDNGVWDLLIRLHSERQSERVLPGGVTGWKILLETQWHDFSSKSKIKEVYSESQAIRALVDAMHTLNRLVDKDDTEVNGHRTIVEALRRDEAVTDDGPPQGAPIGR